MQEKLVSVLSEDKPTDFAVAISYLTILFVVVSDFVFDDVRETINKKRLKYLIVIFVASIPLGFTIGSGVVAVWNFLSGFAPQALVSFWADNLIFGWVMCFVAMDAAGYAYHRVGHTTRVGWAGHRPHHLGEHYNTTLVMRQSWFGIHALITFPLVALLGFDVVIGSTCAIVSLTYQAAQHTSRTWNLGGLRHILVTSETHRSHHSVEGTNKNYGFVFNVWDRIFGTWDPNPVSNKTKYGVGLPEPDSVLDAQLTEWKRLVSKNGGNYR